jgi:heme-degrading monooxygenase HmoA
VIARIWRTRVLAGKEAEYESFVRDRSLPMFREQPGFLGVFFLKSGAERAVITLWRSQNDIHRLEKSPSYRQTVEHITEAGIIGGDSSVEVFFPQGFEFSPAMLNRGDAD